MKILILGIGNILFGDEGVGAHLAHYLKINYEFISDEHTIDILDGGTLAQRLIPIIVEYDKVIVMDCVNVKDGQIGDVYFFDYSHIPSYITWQGSAHEVEMLQTLQMIEMYGDMPTTKIVGVIPYVIGENSTFNLTKEVIKASKLMVQIIINELEKDGIKSIKKNDISLEEIAQKSYLEGIK